MQGHVAGTDADFPRFQVQHLLEHRFRLDKAIVPLGHIGEEDFPFRGEADPFGGAEKQAAAQVVFQVLDDLAHRWLGDKQLLCRR